MAGGTGVTASESRQRSVSVVPPGLVVHVDDRVPTDESVG